MDPNLKVVFGLLGGLAMFLYGMNTMSDYLQKAAGERMKRILGYLTKNPIMGALAGALVTAVLQSSSATTVMVIGFVSAGLMRLPQAISVIFGANIGTTMTAQLLAFKISDYIYPIIFVGFIVSFLAKKENVKNIGMVIFSFGLLFEGIAIMGHVMKPLATSPFFIDLMARVSDTSILGVGLGAMMTIVVQSSSATIAVLQNFAQQPGPDGMHSVIGLLGAIPILFGDNIGTTITALLAAIGQSKNALRTAVAHSTFNITGTILFLFLIHPLAQFVTWISPSGNEVDVIARQIANAHTTFNVVNTLIWLPLIPVMVKIVSFIVPGEDKVDTKSYEPHYLDEHVLTQPVAAIYLVSLEIKRVAENAGKMVADLRSSLSSTAPEAILAQYKNEYNAVKRLQASVSSYVAKLFSSGNLTEVQSERTAELLFISNNIDRIADRCNDIETNITKLKAEGSRLSEAAVGELSECIATAEEIFAKAMHSVETGDRTVLEAVSLGKKKISKAQKKHNKAHLKRVKAKKCSPALTADYAAMLYNIDRIGDSCASIADSAVSNVSFEALKPDDADDVVRISGPQASAY